MSENDYLNILTAPMGRDGCSFNRVTQPYSTMNRLALCAVKQMKQDWSGEEMIKHIAQADVLIIRPGQEILLEFIKSHEALRNFFIVIDLDDDLWDVTPFAETYAHLGTEEVKYGDEWLWKDGEGRFDLARNREALARLITAIQDVDLVTVSTERLKQRITERTGQTNVIVVPNHIDFRHWQKLPLKDHDDFRVGWTGGSTHYVDWHTIKDFLPQALGDSKLVLQGAKWDGTVRGLKYEYHDWVDNEAHPYKVATYGLDMAIIPLKRTDFNQYKSCIKWYEFSSLQVPCVMANVPPYSDEVVHGETGLLYDTPEKFVEYVQLLKNDKPLREKIAKNAYEWVRDNRNAERVAKELYTNLYQHVRKTL